MIEIIYYVLIFMILMMMVKTYSSGRRKTKKMCVISLNYDFQNGLKTKCEISFDSNIDPKDFESIVNIYDDMIYSFDEIFP